MVITNLTIVSFLSSIFLLAIVSIYSYFLFKKESKFEEIEIKAYKDSKEILEKAHEKSEAILNKVVDKSKDILLQTQIFKEYIEKDLKKTLYGAVEEYGKVIKSNSKEVTDAYVEETKKLLEGMGNLGNKSLDDFNKNLKQVLLNSQLEYKKRVDEEFAKAQKDIEIYKKAEFEKVAKSIDEMVLKIAQSVMGKVTLVDNHEKIIFEALEKAKEEGVFS